jgi:hypothetical protein
MWLAGSPLFARGGAAALNVADVFSTDLYTGNDGTQTITNGIDLAGKGGLVWIKRRNETGFHNILDTFRGPNNRLISNSTGVESAGSPAILNSFDSGGFTLGSNFFANSASNTFAAWTFRRAPKFFDVVTYTGDGTAGRTIAHNLGVAPGMIVVKRRDSSGDWCVSHTSVAAVGLLNSMDAFSGSIGAGTPAANGYTWILNSTSTTFFVGDGESGNSNVNASGGTYVAYLFAHDPDPSGVIQCGSYTGNGSTTGPVINLGWEPQWVMIKRSDSTGDWWIYDNERSTTNPRVRKLLANSSAAEDTAGEDVDFTSTGFQPKTTAAGINANTGTYVYAAIRAEGT